MERFAEIVNSFKLDMKLEQWRLIGTVFSWINEYHRSRTDLSLKGNLISLDSNWAGYTYINI